MDKLLPINLAGLLALSISLSAMEKATDQSAYLITINKSLLGKMTIYEKPDDWQLGKLHSFYLLLWAHEGQIETTLPCLTFRRSFDQNMPPSDFVEFLNKNLPYKGSSFVAQQFDELTELKLLDIIRKSIIYGAPLSVYIMQGDKPKLSLLTIFGYRVGDSKTPSTALVVAGFTPNKDPYEMPLVDLLISMNLSPWKSVLDGKLSTIRDKTYFQVQVEFSQQLKSFNIITFQETSPAPSTPPIIPSSPPQDRCIIL